METLKSPQTLTVPFFFVTGTAGIALELHSPLIKYLQLPYDPTHFSLIEQGTNLEKS